MKSMIYLQLTSLKNNIKDLRNNPGKIVLYLIFTLLLVFVIWNGSSSQMPDELRSFSELSAIIFIFYTFIFVTNSLKGVDTGASFYSIADIHFLFTKPISPLKILFYGIVKQLGTSLLLGGFLLFQYAWLHQLYGISFGDLVVILLGYALCIFSSQLTAMCIYSFTSGDDGRKKLVKACIYLYCGLTLLYVIFPVFFGGNLLQEALPRVDSAIVNAFLVSGWIKMSITAVIQGGSQALFFLGFALTFLWSGIFLVFLLRRQVDFYEDVLLAAEISYSAITARKEGIVKDNAPKNVKVGKTGIEKGWGASVFYYKHLLEDRRTRFFILDSTSLIFITAIVVYAWLMRDKGIIPVLVLSTYMQILAISTGRWIRELMLPYAYLIPASSFSKLFHMCREALYKTAVEAVIIYIPTGIILQLSPLDILGCILARTGFGTLFIAGNILIERILGGVLNKVMIVIIYFIIMVVLSLPGIGIALVFFFILASIFPGLPMFFGFLLVFLWNVGISALILALCRNVLDYAELNNR